MTAINVDSILASAPQYKPITVDKEDIQYDLGHLCAYDYAPIDIQQFKQDPGYLESLSRDNVQLLFNNIFQLPSKVEVDGVLAELPKPSTVLPRAKPMPQPKQPTNWERFAKLKGIQKKSRKPQLVWDEDHQEYRRRYGYMRANNPEDQWLIPTSDKHNADPNAVDPFTKMKEDKKVQADKQKEKEQRNKQQANLEKAKTQQQAGSKLKDDISRTFALVSRSTASLGRFDRRLPGEKEAPAIKGTRKMAGLGSAVGGGQNQKNADLALIDKMAAKEDKLNKDRAASQFNKNDMEQKSKRNRDELLSGNAKKRAKKA